MCVCVLNVLKVGLKLDEAGNTEMWKVMLADGSCFVGWFDATLMFLSVLHITALEHSML